MSSDLAASGFVVVNVASDQVVFRGQVEELLSPLGRYQVLDFSAWDSPGVYRIEAGTVHSRSFRFGADIWREALIKTLNSFYAQRCGTAVPGIHDVCHRDWLCVHGERKIVIHGGWHDAGDLSQGVVNTAEAVHALFTLAERLQSTDVALSERLLEEGEWGLDWLLRTRFEGDSPYWPAENCYNWKEIWVHPSTRWLGLMSELAQ